MSQLSYWDAFLTEYVLPFRAKQIQVLHDNYIHQKDRIQADIVQIMDALCQEAIKRQNAGGMKACTLIRVSLLRTSMIDGKLRYVFEAADQEGAENNEFNMTAFHYEADWIFACYQEWLTFCHNKLKEYMGRIAPWSFDSWKNEHFQSFHDYMVHAMRYAIDAITGIVSFKELVKTDVFEIVVGEYGDPLLGESVYYCNLEQKEVEDCKRWLEKGLSYEYIHGHLLGLDLSEGNYQGIHFNYMRSEEINWTGSCFRQSFMIGSKFERCLCPKVDFSDSVMFDADFRGCDLEAARFDRIGAEKNLMNVEFGMIFGIYGVQFQQANLRNVSFRYAGIAGDFRGANLAGVDFTGANLSGSSILKQDRHLLKLTHAQEQMVQWCDS